MYHTKAQTINLPNETFEFIKVEEKDHVLIITLNRPEKKNAFNQTLLNEFAFAMAYAHFEPAVWVVVIAANGTVFSAGADLKSFGGAAENETVSTILSPSEQVVIGPLMNGLHKPCIARIEAPVYAGGAFGSLRLHPCSGNPKRLFQFTGSETRHLAHAGNAELDRDNAQTPSS